MPTAPIVFGRALPGVDAVQVPENRSAELINVYRDIDGRSLRRRPGQTLFKDFAESGKPIIGLFEPIEGTSILTLRNGVSNSVLAKLTSAGTATTITGTTLANGISPTWAEDATSQFVANGARIYQVDIGAATANELSAGNAPASVTFIGFAKTYLVSNGLISGGVAGDTNFSNDAAANYEGASSWRFFNNEQMADACDGLIIDHDEILAFGSRSAEVSFADGVTPWAALDGGFYQYGVANPYTIVKLGSTIYFLGYVDGVPHFIRLNQRQAQIISSPYDSVLRSLTFDAPVGATPNAVAWHLPYRGQTFYCCTFPASDYTLVYSPNFDEWYRWSTYSAGHLEWNINAALYVQDWNKTLIGDKTDAKIFYLDDSNDDAGTAIRSEMTSGLITRGTLNGKRVQRYRFVFKRGDPSDSSEPTVTLELNDNNEGWVTSDSLSLGVAADDFIWVEAVAQGIYNSRQIRLTHSGTKSSLILVQAEETFEVLRF